MQGSAIVQNSPKVLQLKLTIYISFKAKKLTYIFVERLCRNGQSAKQI